MAKGKSEQRKIYVYADWEALQEPLFIGILFASPSRGKEIFSFEYDSTWLRSNFARDLDPHLKLFSGPQYPKSDHANFGLFLDSSPDRWGRVLMRRREEQRAREKKIASRSLMESDYLLGVFDAHRMGALRFKLQPEGPFLDNDVERASPPWAKLRDLEYASLQLENDNAEESQDYTKWLKQWISSRS